MLKLGQAESSAVSMNGGSSLERAFLSGADVLAVTRSTLTVYDASTGKQVLQRTRPAGSTIIGFSGGTFAYAKGDAIHLLRLRDGRDRRVATATSLVAAKLDPSGLFYAWNESGAGHISFIPASALARPLGRPG